MKIVIIAGGTGSIALQRGLYHMLDHDLGDEIQTKVLVNAYDNGLSTGAVRKVMGGEILGPSDVRKNQTTRLKLENSNSPWLPFLDIRFTAPSKDVANYCINEIKKLEAKPGAGPCTLLYGAVSSYFSSPTAEKIDYNDFSLANIIYAGLAHMHGNSLRAAATVMAQMMGIKDNVILNDDRSMFLGAWTRRGNRLLDEGDIVSWGNKDDSITEVFFTSPNGTNIEPVLCDEAKEALLEADLIVMSSGTQWSSLIPTYVSKGFKETLAAAKGKIVMVMNRQPDSDSPGQTASEIVKMIVPDFVPKGRVNLILDSSAHEQMKAIDYEAADLLASVLTENIGDDTDPRKHHAMQLAVCIGRAYFGDALKSQRYIFDYDDTLVGRGNSHQNASLTNKELLIRLNDDQHVAICTGNRIEAINLQSCRFETRKQNQLTVFADSGINEYSLDLSPVVPSEDQEGTRYTLVRRISPQHIIDPVTIQNIFMLLHSVGIGPSKLENRGDVVIAIRPVDPEYRKPLWHLVNMLVEHRFAMEAQMTGRSTIEISRKGLSKKFAVEAVLRDEPSVTYVGDELDEGNDRVIAALCEDHPGLRCVRVNGPVETAFFLKTKTRTRS